MHALALTLTLTLTLTLALALIRRPSRSRIDGLVLLVVFVHRVHLGRGGTAGYRRCLDTGVRKDAHIKWSGSL